jgi:hypothetical protein
MPLETSGTLSIGGTTTNRSINLELGRSATATSSLGETELRDLAGVASGTISISNFYGASSGFNVDNSLKVQANSGNEWFYRSSPTTGNKRTFTFSFWIKRTQLTGYQADPYLMSQGTNARFHFAGDTLRFMFDGNSTEMEAAGKLRDTSAWYHIVLAVDTTQATNTNRVKMYVNGETYPFNNNDWPSLNQESSWMSGSNMYFNTRDGDGSYDNSGYWAEVAVIDGSALTPTSFGEYDDSGTWKPKDLSGLSFGNQGFYLKFDNAASLGADSSGNGKNVTLNNITSADQATDTPTNNFATWNVLDVTRTNTQGVDMLEGATNIKHRGASGWTGTMSTMAVSKGKWYWEAEVRAVNGTSMWGAIPVSTREASVYFDSYIGGSESNGYDSGVAFYDNDDGYYHDNTFTACTISGSTFNTQAGDVVMIAVDMDNNKLYAGVNGNWCNSSNNTLSNATGITLSDEPHFLAAATYIANTTNSYNLGGFTTDTISSAATDGDGWGTFEYTPPSGYYALCTKNLAEYG